MVVDKNREKNPNNPEECPPKKYGYGIRHVQMACMSLTMMALFIARGSMGVAVLAMSDENRLNDTGITVYNWDKKTQSLILSSFFWGYVVMQIPAGVLAKKFGGKTILFYSLLINGCLCLLLPSLAAVGGWASVCGARVVMGLSQACLFPASHTLLGQWLPPSERTSYSGMVYGGVQIGNIIAMPVSGLLAETSIGWKLIFYAISGMLFVTAAVWFWFTASYPAAHRMISVEEKAYIETALNTTGSQRTMKTPWKHILTARCMWAILATHFGTTVGFTLFFVDMPTYLEKGLQISLKNSASLSALPYVGMWLGCIVSTVVAEKLINKNILKIGACRKVFNSLSMFGIASGLVALSFLGPEDKSLAIVVLIGTLTMLGFSAAGYTVNFLDLSPNFAGILLSLTNFISNFGSVATPIVTSIILRNDSSDVSRWRIVFLLAATLAASLNVIYVLFSSSEKQEWNDPDFLDKDKADPGYGYGIRHLQVFAMTLTMVCLIIARASMGVAVLAMSDARRINDTNIEIYDWDKKTQSLILSAFFWGYVVMQIPSGIISRKFGGKPILTFALASNAVVCLTVPTLAAWGGWILVCASRVVIGLTQACTFSATHALLGQWLPDSETTSYTCIVYGGVQLGTIIAMPISGVLAETTLGWKLIFYAIAGLLFLDTVFWYFFAASSPREHRMISKEERAFIEAGLNISDSKKPPRTPWKHILKSGPVWSLLAPHFGFALSFVLFFVDMPTYLEKGLQISLKNSAMISALPYIGMWAGGMMASYLASIIFEKKLMSMTACRKLFQSVALFGVAIGLIILSFLGPDKKVFAVVMIIIILTMSGFASAGFLVNLLDLSPNFAGLILSLLNFLANSGSIIMPIVTGYILKNDPTNISRWQIVFLIIAGIAATANVIYLAFGTSDRQEWDDPDFLKKKMADPEEITPVLNKEKDLQNQKDESKS